MCRVPGVPRVPRVVWFFVCVVFGVLRTSRPFPGRPRQPQHQQHDCYACNENIRNAAGPPPCCDSQVVASNACADACSDSQVVATACRLRGCGLRVLLDVFTVVSNVVSPSGTRHELASSRVLLVACFTLARDGTFGHRHKEANLCRQYGSNLQCRSTSRRLRGPCALTGAAGWCAWVEILPRLVAGSAKRKQFNMLNKS